MPWVEGEALTPTNLNAVGTGMALFSVTDPTYGAKGDGVTDDTTAIQAAITAAKAVGGTVYFPSSTSDYRIASRLVIDTAGVTLQGVGSGKDFSGTVIRLTSTATDAILVKANNTEINSIRLVGPGRGTTTSRGIVVDDEVHTSTVFNVRMRNVNISSFGSDGLYLRRPELCSFEHVISQANGGQGFVIIGDSLALNNRFINCRANNNDGLRQAYFQNAESTLAVGLQCLGASASSNQTLVFVDGGDQFTDINGDYELGNTGIRLVGSGHILMGTSFFGVVQGASIENTPGNPCFVTNLRASTSDTSRILNIANGASVVIGPRVSAAPLADAVGSAISATYLDAFRLRVPDGIAAQPTLAFTSEASLGFYRSFNSFVDLSYGTLRTVGLSSSLFSSAASGGVAEILVGNTNAQRSGSTTTSAAYYMDVGTLRVRDGDGTLAQGYLGVYQGSASRPGYFFTSEESLGLYRSTASTLALSYGTLNLSSGILSGIRATSASATSATLNDGEFRIAAVSATSAELAYRSGNTTYRFIAAATAL